MKRPSKEKFYEALNEVKKNNPELGKTEIKEKVGKVFEVTGHAVYDWIRYFNNMKVETEVNEKSYKNMNLWQFFDLYEEADIHDDENRYAHIKIDADEIFIVCLSDIHLGNEKVDRDRLRQDIKDIGDNKDIYALFNGDLIDYTYDGPDDLATEQVFSNPTHLKQFATLLIEEISDSLLGMVTGCHDEWDGDPLVMRLKDKTLSEVAAKHFIVIDLELRNVTYRIYMRHKMKNHSSYNRCHSVFKDRRDKLQFDIGIEGHLHEPSIGVQFEQQKPVYAICCGTYKRLDNYAARVGFVGNDRLQVPGIWLSGNVKKCVPFIDWRDWYDIRKGTSPK